MENSEKLVFKKTPNPVDRHVGSRVRMRRVLVGLSQERLGESLGLTFQQVQKYEKGTNRIGASLAFRWNIFSKERPKPSSVLWRVALKTMAIRPMSPIFWQRMKAFN